MHFRIAVLPGDGIGPEVTAQALRILKSIEVCLPTTSLELTEYSVGAGEYLSSGNPLPDEAMEACRGADAILLGAMGLPGVRWPNGTEIAPQLDLREQLDLYCGIRPCKLYHSGDTPLKGYQGGDIDLILVRENTEGLFFGRKHEQDFSAPEVRDTLRISRFAAERICRSAFQIASSRHKRLTLIDKANVLPSMAYFRAIYHQVAAEFPDVKAECLYVDAAALYLVRCPERFDVLVTENMFGDILSDLAAGIVGGMGVAPSADIGERHAVFQPSHGSAPDIAGKGIANPIAAILSAAMMLNWLPSDETKAAGTLIESTLKSVLADPAFRTPDMKGGLTTEQMGDRILAALEQRL